MIIIEGQIGVGKTTIGEVLEERYGISLFRELTRQSTLELLDSFYADKKRWAFTLQVHFLNERFRMIKEIFKNGGGLLDRSIYGDRIFADLLHADGDMNSQEFETYETLLNNMLEHAQKPDLLVYLDCSVDTALARIKRRNRGLEAGIPRQYLEKLNERYLRWFEEYDLSPKIMIDTETFHVDYPEQLEDALLQIDEKLKRSSRYSQAVLHRQR
ncbi:MAG: deoxynucleoside kinase [Alkalispirochaetaceae bacterium]